MTIERLIDALRREESEPVPRPVLNWYGEVRRGPPSKSTLMRWKKERPLAYLDPSITVVAE